MRNLRKFKTEEEFEKYARTEDSLVTNGLYLIESGCKVKYYDQDEPFYIEAIEDLSFNLFSCFYNGLSYSFDLKSWITIRSGAEGALTVPAGKKIYFKYVSSVNKNDKQFKISGKYNVGGNLSSISNIGVNNLFLNETGLISAENLIINSRMSLKNSFKGCINLISAPKIIYMTHDTTWTNHFLDNTFEGCVNLTKCPAFWGYIHGARNTCLGCSNLSEIDIMSIADTFIDSNCFTNLLEGVSETGLCTLNWNASTKVHSAVIANIPSGWEIRYYDSVNDKYYIKFTIDGIKYVADYNMTWKDWINSDYNTIGLTYDKNSYTENRLICSTSGYVTINDAKIKYTDKIKTEECYEYQSNIYIQHVNKTLYTMNDWISNGFDNSLANGVAITNDDGTGIVFAKSPTAFQFWGPSDVLIGTSTEFGTGKSNTILIKETLIDYDNPGSHPYCAMAASRYKFPNGEYGFLPSIAEMRMFLNNLDIMYVAGNLIGGYYNNNQMYSSSSESSISTVYAIYTREKCEYTDVSKSVQSLSWCIPALLLETTQTEPETQSEE